MASEEMKATEVAALLDLKPHPEGGFYAETFRDGSVTLTTSQLPPHCTYIRDSPVSFDCCAGKRLLYFNLSTHEVSLHRIVCDRTGLR